MNDKEFENKYVHTPNYGYGKNSDKTCQFGVHDSGRGVGFHQCPNPVSKQIRGFGFCTVHAKRIETELGLNADEGVNRYVCGKSYSNDPYIELAKVIKESDKSMTVIEVRSLYGHREHYSSVIKKSKVLVFDKARQATEWAVKELRRKADAEQRQAEHYAQEADKLENGLK